jgi:hypothetical protein
VKEFMNKRQIAIAYENFGVNMFSKINMNGSYGYDGMNTEKYTRISICDLQQTITKQCLGNFCGTRQLNDDTFAVELDPETCGCKTPLQEAVFTLDNAKFWYLTFYYNFMCKCLDMEHIHVVELDTDSLYLAIAGNPDKDYHQRFEAVIKDKDYYDKHYGEWFPTKYVEDLPKDTSKDEIINVLSDEKKLLGLAIENEKENMIALCPKCYSLFNDEEIDSGKAKMRVKGVSLKKNKLCPNNYKGVIENKDNVNATNVNLQMKKYDDFLEMSKVRVSKIALSYQHTKMIVLKNESCVPFIYGVDASKWVCQ